MYENHLKPIEFPSAEIIFRNFSGRRTNYNAEGNRNFSVVIPDPQYAIQLYNMGWNVQIRPRQAETRVDMKKACHTFEERVAFLEQRGEINDAVFHLKVNIGYKYDENGNLKRGPLVYLYRSSTQNKREKMYESNIGTLDKAEIEHIDLVIEPVYSSNSKTAGGTGYLTFLKEAHVFIHESSFAEKYKDYYDEDEAE